MRTTKRPLYDTRKNGPNGIYWRGWWYEGCPQIKSKWMHPGRVMIVEDHGDYLMVSDFNSGSWHSPCEPKGPLYRVNRLGIGRPTKTHIDRFREAVRELQPPPLPPTVEAATLDGCF